jgi:hypothetical protein
MARDERHRYVERDLRHKLNLAVLEQRINPYIVTQIGQSAVPADYNPGFDPSIVGTLRYGFLETSDSIDFHPNVFANGPVSLEIDSRSLQVNRSLEIVGPGYSSTGQHLLTIASIVSVTTLHPEGNLFVVEYADIFSTGDIQVKFSGFAITKGNATDPGGGILVAGWVNMILNNMRVFNNSSAQYGGGISIQMISGAGEPPPVGPLGPFIPQMTIADSQKLSTTFCSSLSI